MTEHVTTPAEVEKACADFRGNFDRLRGEVGRAIFMEDIEKEAFGDLVRK